MREIGPRGWTFIGALVLIVLLYGIAAVGSQIGLDSSDRKQVVIYANIVVAGVIGLLGIPAIRNGGGKNQ